MVPERLLALAIFLPAYSGPPSQLTFHGTLEPNDKGTKVTVVIDGARGPDRGAMLFSDMLTSVTGWALDNVESALRQHK